jgi:hypothetical protein
MSLGLQAMKEKECLIPLAHSIPAATRTLRLSFGNLELVFGSPKGINSNIGLQPRMQSYGCMVFQVLEKQYWREQYRLTTSNEADIKPEAQFIQAASNQTEQANGELTFPYKLKIK